MLIKKTLLLSLCITGTLSTAQNKKTVINPKGQWYFGIEMGSNTILGYKLNEPKNSFQSGIISEYFLNDKFSITARFKYIKTGVSFTNGYKPEYGHFDGSVICIPINAHFNLNSNIDSKFYPSAKLGLAWNHETESNYTYTNDYAKSYLNINLGIGLNYMIDKKYIVYTDVEGYFLGGYKGSSETFIFKRNYYTQNILINFGIKRVVFGKKQ
ncbi:outer membrane beta-barrel protein [Flavobacterium branchiophilum]|uniref:Outer membrane protein beta-barrel domain-containing protein n=1 Tax=Flavobacterium branchiophilum (strain FL-15) TaxID=1034807 RepID=G2Z4D4_FLABF|nr:outer membrane beta-barrel protein [Flavobacterium branchiophilum]CCB68409.1 Protein of unknown function precursor [Flavobacterium branchiophilum FL-15]